MVVLLLLTTVRGAWTEAAPPVDAGLSAAETGAVAPDIGRMTPSQRFDRLYDRVMQAAQSGDEATMSRFMPMALGAYEMLDSVDADARYHAALLRVHNGDVEGSRALGDSILEGNPGHLLGYIVLGTTARWNRDEAALTKAYRGFLAHYDAEMEVRRPEYGEHRASIDRFRREAQTGGQGARPGS
ncbi:MAG TPA: hypothetical protein VHG35_18340 [Gemmatimonadales bacterium]|nr:hypothetical protein [Gemmatimonadales bacterium]